jgi:hypothetical protein
MNRIKPVHEIRGKVERPSPTNKQFRVAKEM